MKSREIWRFDAKQVTYFSVFVGVFIIIHLLRYKQSKLNSYKKYIY